MLLTRVITALALLPVVLGALFAASPGGWALFALAIALVSCWEWSRLCGFTPAGQSAYLAASGAIGAYVWLLALRFAPGDFTTLAVTTFLVAAAFWAAGATAWLARLARPSPSSCAVAGWIVVWPTWFALVVLRDASPWILLAAAALVWVADISAYFAGKAFGRHKLAPSVSPGKTWEGVAGGMAGVLAYGVALDIAAHVWDIPISFIFEPALGVPAVALMLVLAGLSVVGDLLESWMKRGAGLKDSSGLLPGHGGLLDRIDALTSTLPLAALAVFLMQRAAG